MYPVGSRHAKMFRVIEKQSGTICTCKRVTLKMLDPTSYQVFLSAVKEALFLKKNSSSSPESLLPLRGYYFVKRDMFQFWDLQVELLMLYEDHDVCMLDLLRSRKLSKMPWEIEQAEVMLARFSKELDEIEKRSGIKIVYPNSLNLVYSKAKDVFQICNLQNILVRQEKEKVFELEKSSQCDIRPNMYFNAVFPQLGNLYTDQTINKYSELRNEYSMGILSMQVLEISYMNVDLNVSQQLKEVLTLKMHKQVSMRKVVQSKELMGSLRQSMASKMRQSMATGQGPSGSREGLHQMQINQTRSQKLRSEIKAINAWKKIVRRLKPEENFRKQFYQGEFLLLVGNQNKAINYVRSAIQEFTQVGELDIADWIDLICFLINCFKQVGLRQEASEYAQSLVLYVEKAVQAQRVNPCLGQMLTLTLRSIYVDPKDVYEEACKLGLPDFLFCSMKYHLLNISLEMPFEVKKYTPPSGGWNAETSDFKGNQSDVKFIEFLGKRECNYFLMNNLASRNFINSGQYLENLSFQLKEYPTLKIKKQLIYLNNLAVGNFVVENKMEANEIMAKIEKIIFQEKSKLKNFQFVDLLNTRAVFYMLKGTSPMLKNAINLLREAKTVIEKLAKSTPHKSEKVILNNLAICHSLTGNHPQAKEIISHMFQQINHESQKKPIYMINLAVVLAKGGDYNMAQKIISKIKNRIVQQDNFEFDNQLCKNIYLAGALTQIKMGNYEAALQYLDEYGEYLKPQQEDPVSYAKFKRLKAIVNIKMKKYETAKQLLDF